MVWKRFHVLPLISLVVMLGASCNNRSNVDFKIRTTEDKMNPSAISRTVIEGRVYTQVKANKLHEAHQAPIAGAVVYLVSAEGVDVKSPEQPVVLHVKNGRVEPPFACVVVGQELVVKIADDRQYNIIVNSSVEEFGQIVPYAPDCRQIRRVFSKPTIAAFLKCAIDPKLHAYFTVLPNPIFARTGEKGNYRLPIGLPPGKYELRAYEPNCGLNKSTVEIRPSEESKVVDFVLPPSDDL